MSWHPMIQRAANRAKSFRRDGKGQVAIIFGLAILPLLGFVGTAVDYARATNTLASLNAAADAAALNAVAKGRVTHTAPDQATIQNFFTGSAALNPGVTISNFQVTSSNSATTLYVQIDYQAHVPTTFMNIFGYNSMTMTGTAKAATDLPPFVDFQILMDNSPSMGVAGSTADINRMQTLTPDGCAFACHKKNADGSENNSDYYHVAKNANPPITLRIDLLRQAVQNLMDTAAGATLIPNQFRMGLYTFSDTFQTVAPISPSLSTLKGQAGAIDLAYAYQDENDMQTSFDKALPTMNGLIDTPGNGMTAGAPQKFLFLVTDGVQDERTTLCQASPSGPSGKCNSPTGMGGRLINTLNPALCKTIKDRGIKIALLYTPYLPLPTNWYYNNNVANLDNNNSTTSAFPGIVPALTACASPGFFFQISGTQSIDQAMQAMFQTAVKYARLVN